jgi:hypothetical protein
MSLEFFWVTFLAEPASARTRTHIHTHTNMGKVYTPPKSERAQSGTKKEGGGGWRFLHERGAGVKESTYTFQMCDKEVIELVHE